MRHTVNNIIFLIKLSNIGNALRWNDALIWVGFSFLMMNHKNGEDEIVYVYAARELSPYRYKFHDKVKFIQL